MKPGSKLWVAIAVLIILSPLGLLLPEYFKSGTSWGEWGSEELQKMLGYLPRGLGKLADLWKAPFPDYAFKGWQDKGLAHLSLAYIVSAVLGVVLTVILVFLIGKLLSKKDD